MPSSVQLLACVAAAYFAPLCLILWLELINKLSRVGMGGWLDQVGIRLTELSTKLKLKLKLNLVEC